MKKKIAAALIGMTLAMTATAMADVTLQEAGSIEGDVDWVDGSNLLEQGGYGARYMTDLSGNALTDEIYGSFSSEYGYVMARRTAQEEGDVNTYGLLTQAGEVVIPCEYGDIKLRSDDWAVCYRLKEADANNYDYETFFGEDAWFLIDSVDLYHLGDDGVTLVHTFPREAFLDYYIVGDYINIQNRSDEKVTMYDGDFNVVTEDLRSVYDDGEVMTGDYETFYENGQYGIRDREGNVIVEPCYRTIYDVSGDLVRVSTGEKEGLIDLNGQVKVPVEYDSVRLNYYGPKDYEGFDAAGYVAVERDGKAAFCDLNGNETMEAKYAADNVDVRGASATMTDLEGNVHILAADGVDTVLDEAHKDCRALSYGNGILYTFTNEDYNDGLMDWHGNEILPAKYRTIALSGDGSMLLVSEDYDSAQLFTVDYGEISGAPESDGGEALSESADEPAAEAEATAGTEQAASVEVETNETADAGSDLTPAGALLDSIISLVDSDLDTNRASISSLLGTLTSLLGEDQGDLKAVLDSAGTLVGSGAGDTQTIKTLLESVRSML